MDSKTVTKWCLWVWRIAYTLFAVYIGDKYSWLWFLPVVIVAQFFTVMAFRKEEVTTKGLKIARHIGETKADKLMKDVSKIPGGVKHDIQVLRGKEERKHFSKKEKIQQEEIILKDPNKGRQQNGI